jgi:hypothetical protein
MNSEIVVDGKTKTTVYGFLLVIAGAGCFFLFVVVYFINAARVPAPASTTTGNAMTYSPSVVTSDHTRQLSGCSYNYSVEGKTYTILSTCGDGLFLPGDRPGDKVEIIYQRTKPSNGMVKRQSFFNVVGILGFPLLIFGWVLIRKGRRMPASNGQN